MNWRREQLGPIGIHLGARNLRAMQLRCRAGSWMVHAAAHQRLEVAEAVDPAARQLALKKLLSGGGFQGRWAATCLAADDVELKSLRLPDMPPEELEAAAQYEIRERFPDLSDAEFATRMVPVGAVGSNAGSQQEVLVLAAQNAAVEGRLRMLIHCGLTVTGLESSSGAFFRPFARFLQRETDTDSAHAFVDLGWRGSRVIIVRGREIVFLKNCMVGGAVLDDRVAQALSLSKEEASDVRRCCWSSPDEASASERAEAVKEAVRGAVEQLSKEVSLCLRYYAVTFRGSRPESVTCGGSEAGYEPLLEMLSASMGVPFRVGHALRGVEVGTVFDEGQVAAGLPEWTTAAGLAFRPRMGFDAVGRVA